MVYFKTLFRTKIKYLIYFTLRFKTKFGNYLYFKPMYAYSINTYLSLKTSNRARFAIIYISKLRLELELDIKYIS